MNSISEFNHKPKAVTVRLGNEIEESTLNQFINLNKIFQNNLEQYRETLNKTALVLRCDSLPSVYGDTMQMHALFNLLFKIILLNLPAKNNLFIYIKCEVDKEDIIDMTLKNGFSNFNISVYSNTFHLKDSINHYQQELTEIKNICFNFSGSFKEHTSAETGCLFTICLPGKTI